jgi:hypothetical protein
MEMFASTGPPEDVSEDRTIRAIAWLTAWDAQGIHRTATAGDEAGADWLIREAAALGATPAVEKFALDRLDPTEAYLEFDDTRVPGVPVFDAPATGDGGVAGVLGPVSAETSIAVAELSPLGVYSPDYESLRRNAAHRGLVIVCKGARSGLGRLNAERFRQPYGPPAIHVSSEARDGVLAAAARRVPARLVAASRRTPARACNVVVTIGGQDRTRAPVVVMTPRSSWWQSTSERGGGLVCWLESLRALLASPPLCDVILTANSGHELGHLGPDDFMARRPGRERPIADGGAIWVHYGANIGAVGGELSIQSASDDLRALAVAELTPCRPTAGPHRAEDAGSDRRDAGYPPRRRLLCHAGRKQSAVSSAPGPLAARRRSRCRRPGRRCRLPSRRWADDRHIRLRDARRRRTELILRERDVREVIELRGVDDRRRARRGLIRCNPVDDAFSDHDHRGMGAA